MPLLWRSSRESRSERCKRAFLLAPICKVLLAPSLVSDRATIRIIRSVSHLPEKSGIYHFLINLSSGMGEWYMKVVYNSFDS